MPEKIPTEFNNEPEKWEKEIKLVEKPDFADVEKIAEPEALKETDNERNDKIKKLEDELALKENVGESAVEGEDDVFAGAEEVQSRFSENMSKERNSAEVLQEKPTKTGTGKYWRRLVALASLVGLGFAGSQNEVSADDVKTADKNTNNIPTFAGGNQEKTASTNKVFNYNQGKWVTDAKTGKRILQTTPESAGKTSYNFEQKDWSKVGTPEQIAERTKMANAAKEKLKNSGNKWGNVK